MTDCIYCTATGDTPCPECSAAAARGAEIPDLTGDDVLHAIERERLDLMLTHSGDWMVARAHVYARGPTPADAVAAWLTGRRWANITELGRGDPRMLIGSAKADYEHWLRSIVPVARRYGVIRPDDRPETFIGDERRGITQLVADLIAEAAS